MKKTSLAMFFPFILLSLFLPASSLASAISLSKGYSLFARNESHVAVFSISSYACGFYLVGSNAYIFSIWVSSSAAKTVVWSANRDQPINGRGSKITMRKNQGLVLSDASGVVVWSTNIRNAQADRVELLDTGNLVVKDTRGNIIWQSFDYPTDTLLASQPMTKTTKLVAAVANGSLASGFYSFYFDNDNVLKLIYNETSSIYWPNIFNSMRESNRNTYNSSRSAILDPMGQFISSDNLTFEASDVGHEILRRLTLDHDGNLRLYSFADRTGTWLVSWEAFSQLCLVHGVCGKNGICSYSPQTKPSCSCPRYYDMSNPGDWSKGCNRTFNLTGDKKLFDFYELPHVDFWGFDLSHSFQVSLETCKQTCLNDGSCAGLLYRFGVGECYTKGDEFGNLFNGGSSPRNTGKTYLKVPKNATILSAQNNTCSISEETVVYKRDRGSRVKWSYFYLFVSAFGAIELLFLVAGWWFISRVSLNPNPTSSGEGYEVMLSQIKKFTYKELKKATGNFKHELGRGASGAAFKGSLDDGRVVAVKKLEDMSQGEEEFQAELNLIGRINHMNLVRMFGFCAEGKRRLLVAEYVENGSLDKHLFDDHNTGRTLGWEERYNIAIGVAKGLAYLHHECLEWVIHCDIKPENILLDSDFEPKIADFGLAKLTNRGAVDWKISHVRGTRGYMAPEWSSNLPITSKVDVYSYGVVLLELVIGCRISRLIFDEKGSTFNMDLIGLMKSMKVKLGSEDKSWIGEFVDIKLNGQFNIRQAEVMLETSISCLEVERNQRPTMDLVVQKLLSSDE